VFYKRALSDAESAIFLLDAGDHIAAQILTFRGCAASGFPWDITAGNTATSSTLVFMPSGTTTVDNTLIVGIGTNGTDTSTPQMHSYSNASLANLTEVASYNTTSGNGGGFSIVTGELATAGAFSHTLASLSTASQQGRLTIALMP
jgi:hypothetical protein